MRLSPFRPTLATLSGVRLSLGSFAPPTKYRRPTRRIVASSGVVPERIAVIGGGLAGLATTYHLLNSTYRVANKRGENFQRIHVDIFDPSPPGEPGGASAVAAGLLHPFSPRVKKMAWKAVKGMDAAKALINAAQLQTDVPLMKVPGIARLSLNDLQYADFSTAAHRFPRELEMLNPEALLEKLPDPPPGKSAVFQLDGAVVDTANYLRALWAACEETGRVGWVQREVGAFEDVLEDYDAVVVCAGAATRAISNLASLPVMACRGQIIRYRPKFDKTPLTPCPVISGKWLIPDMFSEREGDLLGGASFEYCDVDESPEFKLDFARGKTEPDLEEAKRTLTEPLSALMPMLDDLYEGVEAVSGVRALPPRSLVGSVPIAGEISGTPEGKSAWVFTALGSRGLLYHAWLGKLVARSVVGGCDVLLPIDVKRVDMRWEDLAGPHNPLTATKLQEKKKESPAVPTWGKRERTGRKGKKQSSTAP